MFRENYFDICAVNAVMDVMQKEALRSSAEYKALRVLHCVHWADMGPVLAAETRKKVLELLSLEVFAELPSTAPVEAPVEKKRSFLSWVK
jgi:hypothetical protein